MHMTTWTIGPRNVWTDYRNDSTVDLISFTMVAREAGTISLWLVYSSNITVCDALALSEGEIQIKTSRSFFAA